MREVRARCKFQYTYINFTIYQHLFISVWRNFCFCFCPLFFTLCYGFVCVCTVCWRVWTRHTKLKGKFPIIFRDLVFGFEMRVLNGILCDKVDPHDTRYLSINSGLICQSGCLLSIGRFTFTIKKTCWWIMSTLSHNNCESRRNNEKNERAVMSKWSNFDRLFYFLFKDTRLHLVIGCVSVLFAPYKQNHMTTEQSLDRPFI